VLRRSSPSAVSTQGAVDREYSAVRRRQPCRAETVVVVSRVGLSVIHLRDVELSLAVSRLGRSRLFAVRPCRRWSLFVADSRRGAVTTLSVFRQALWSTASRFQPALVVSRYPSQVRPIVVRCSRRRTVFPFRVVDSPYLETIPSV